SRQRAVAAGRAAAGLAQAAQRRAAAAVRGRGGGHLGPDARAVAAGEGSRGMSAGPARDAIVAAVAGLAPSFAETFRDPWWLIGSTAMLLSGVDGVVPGDIDVLTSERDAEAFVARHADMLDGNHRPPGDALFRSRFARFRF